MTMINKKHSKLISLGKLKRLLFIALLVGFSCEDEEKDCAGVEGGARLHAGIVDHRSSIAAFRSVIKEFSEGV